MRTVWIIGCSTSSSLFFSCLLWAINTETWFKLHFLANIMSLFYMYLQYNAKTNAY